MPDQAECPICASTSDKQGLDPLDRKVSYSCPVCGRFQITEEAEGEVRRLTEGQKALLSGCVKERSDKGNIAELWTTNLKDLLSTAPTTLNEKLGRLLAQLANRSRFFGNQVRLAPNDRALGYAMNPPEFDAQIRCLAELGWVKILGAMGDGTFFIALTVQGINEIEKMAQNQKEFSNKAFVAMSFNESLNSLYDDHIKTAILAAGYDEPLRVDREHYNDRIDDQIIVGLKQCKFVVADFTFQRNGVYYEAGFAHGQGKQVIMCCPTSEKDNLHFDTNHFNHIVYENGEELRTRLRDRILATIGPGLNYQDFAHGTDRTETVRRSGNT